MKPLDVSVEKGQKRVFAAVLDWPGWCRSGPDEAQALQALLDYGPRYKKALGTAAKHLTLPTTVADLHVAHRVQGSATTDFGAPDGQLPGDTEALTAAESERLATVLRAIWRHFDATVKRAEGHTLQRGPRGGGRDLAKIVWHLYESDQSYTRNLTPSYKPEKAADPFNEEPRLRKAVLAALTAAARDELPKTGPRGGKLWPPRYFVRRFAWHTLDHLWEIEDRLS